MPDPSEYSKISWDEAKGGRVGPLPDDHVFPSDVALTLKPYTIPLETDYVALSLCHIGPGESSEMERTKVAEEVYYIAQGQVRFRIGEKDVVAKQHDAVRVPAQRQRRGLLAARDGGAHRRVHRALQEDWSHGLDT